jgi:uncharacterized protein (DUF4415 family)
MPRNKNAIATDLKRLDAHVVQPSEYEDAPELTDEQLARADLHEGGKLIRRGRPPSPTTRKRPVKLRVDPNVLAVYRASGPGWQTRMAAVLQIAAMNKRLMQMPPSALKAVAGKSTMEVVRVGKTMFIMARRAGKKVATKSRVKKTPRILRAVAKPHSHDKRA